VRRLLVRPGALGDFVVSLPALEFLLAEYTEVWCSRENVPLAKFCSPARFCDQARAITETSLDQVGVLDFPQHLAQQLNSFDEVVTWYGSNRQEFRQAMATHVRTPIRYCQALPDPNGDHAVDQFARQVGAPTGLVPRIPISISRKNQVAIHPFSGGRSKNWPLEKFVQLAESLTSPIVWVCGPEHRLPFPSITPQDRWQLATLLAESRLFIGNDSGPGHLAAAVGTPVLSIFGPTNPLVWAPRGTKVSVANFESSASKISQLAHQLLF
jgi:heptosyltransferase III